MTFVAITSKNSASFLYLKFVSPRWCSTCVAGWGNGLTLAGSPGSLAALLAPHLTKLFYLYNL